MGLPWWFSGKESAYSAGDAGSIPAWGFAVPSPVDHILSDLFTMTRLSWVAPRAWLSFIELDKAVVPVQDRFKQLLIWEGRGCREKGGAAKKQ